MATLTIDDKTARKIYPTADPELKAILEDSYTKAFFTMNIMDRIKSFEDACEYNNTNPKAKKFTQGTRNQIYQERVAEIITALNEGWLANYDDPNEYKYTPYFYLNAPGFRFDVSAYDDSFTYSTSGSRFALKNITLADYAGKQFTKEYEYWLMPISKADCNKSTDSNSIPPKPFTGDMKAWEAYIMERVTSFESACAEVGEDPDDDNFFEGEADEIAYKRGKIIVRALNGPHILTFKDHNQKKWHAWLEHDGTGFRFGASDSDRSGTSTASGSRLRLCSEVLAKYFATQFPGVMMPFWD